MKIGIIISNHKFEPETDKMARKLFGLDDIRYYKHPDINPESSKSEVWTRAMGHVSDILSEQPSVEISVAIINGEYGFSTACVELLKTVLGIKCYYPTTKRNAVEKIIEGGKIETTHVYEFVQFREW